MRAMKRRKPHCGFLGCREPFVDGSYMCASHREALSGVKEAMEKDEDPYGTRTRGSKRSAPRCTKTGCRNPRKPGHSMCADCAEDAFWEGEED